MMFSCISQRFCQRNFTVIRVIEDSFNFRHDATKDLVILILKMF